MTKDIREIDLMLRPEGRETCPCGCGRFKGCCDKDFPQNTHAFDYNDGQVRAMAEGRAALGIKMPQELVARAAYLMDRPKDLDRKVVLKGEGDDILVTDNHAVTDNPHDDVTDNHVDAPDVTLNQVVCTQCGDNFEAKRIDAKYCSTACRVKAHRT